MVTGSGTTYNVAVSGMTGDGTVIVSIPAGVALDAGGNLNTASTSTDNMVMYVRRDVLMSQLVADGQQTLELTYEVAGSHSRYAFIFSPV